MSAGCKSLAAPSIIYLLSDNCLYEYALSQSDRPALPRSHSFTMSVHDRLVKGATVFVTGVTGFLEA